MKATTAELTIETKRHIDDKTGREVVTFTPVFTPDVTARGELRFAAWQRWEDEPDTFLSAKSEAVQNAVACMKLFYEQLARSACTQLFYEQLARS